MGAATLIQNRTTRAIDEDLIDETIDDLRGASDILSCLAHASVTGCQPLPEAYRLVGSVISGIEARLKQAVGRED